jgi:TrmH family RNA methyltransferase
LHLKKHRSEQRCFLVEGPTTVEAALASNAVVLERIFVHPDVEHPAAAAIAKAAGVPVFAVDERTMRSLAQTQTPQGIVAVARFFDQAVDRLAASTGDESRPLLVVILHDIGDPGNAGALIRSADAFGAGAICFGHNGVDPYNEKVVRASMGSMFHLPLLRYEAWPQMAQAARAAHLTVIGAQAGAPDVRGAAIPERVALLVGHERRGLSGVPADDIGTHVGIPQSARAESLNAAVAGSIVMYEIARISGSLPTSAARTNNA